MDKIEKMRAKEERKANKISLFEKIQIKRLINTLKKNIEISKSIKDEKERKNEEIRMKELIRQTLQAFDMEDEEGKIITEADIINMTYEELERKETEIIEELEKIIEKR